MANDLLSEIEKFQAETGLSDHRVGIILARNGRLMERLRNPKRRIWPETAAQVRLALEAERRKRNGTLQ